MEDDIQKPAPAPVPAVHRRRSLFWPVVLVLVGVYLLLNNLGTAPTNLWELAARYWPVLLILMGLDSLWQGDGLSGPLLLIGAGTVLLLNNLGLLAVNFWELILNLWPVFLIALGVDIVVARRAWWAKLLGVLVVAAILAAAMFSLGISVTNATAVEPVGGAAIRHELQGAASAQVNVKPGAGDLQLAGGAAAGVLIEGSLPEEGSQEIAEDFTLDGDRAVFFLRQTGMSQVMPGRVGRWLWSLKLNEETPLDLVVEMGAGTSTLDLSRLMITGLDVNLGVGNTEIVLPQSADFSGSVDGAIGNIEITVPPGVGLQVEADTAIGVVSAPDDYVREGDRYTSPGFDQAEHQIRLKVDSAIGQVLIRTGSSQ